MLEIILKILFVVFSSVAAGMIGFVSYRIGNKDGLKLKEKEVKYHRETIAGLTNKLQVKEDSNCDVNWWTAPYKENKQ